MNGWSPRIASGPLAPSFGRYAGALSSSKSGMSSPVHFSAASSHQTSFFRSDHGAPSGSAEARL